MSHPKLESESILSRLPRRPTHKPLVVLKFGGTTVGSTPEEGKIGIARALIADYLERDLFVVPVFSAFRRGRSGSAEKISITDRLQNYATTIGRAATFRDGVEAFRRSLREPHLTMMKDLKLGEDASLVAEIEEEIDHLTETAEICCRAHEPIPSLDAYLITGGERLSTRILAAYLNRLHGEGKFPMRTARVTAVEMGLHTDGNFGNARIRWDLAVEHVREVLFGKYLEQGIMPIVTGFDGIYDPNEAFPDMMRDDRLYETGRRFTGVYRTALGRGGSDLTATFLGLALGAEYVGFVKETPGVLSGDDMLVGDTARTIPELDYDLATEAGNIYPKAVEPVRAGKVPVHIFDPRTPEEYTAITDVNLSDGLYLITHPSAAMNIHVGAIPDEPGELMRLLKHFGDSGVSVAEVRHQRSGTDVIVEADADEVASALDALDAAGYRPQPTHVWYVRVIGNITPELTMAFNEFVREHHPNSSASFQVGTRALTATFPRIRAGTEARETERIRAIVKRMHDELVVPNLGGKVTPPTFTGAAAPDAPE